MNVVVNERDVRNLIWEMANSDNVRIRHHERNYRINSRVTLTCNDICFGKLFTMQIMIEPLNSGYRVRYRERLRTDFTDDIDVTVTTEQLYYTLIDIIELFKYDCYGITVDDVEAYSPIYYLMEELQEQNYENEKSEE